MRNDGHEANWDWLRDARKTYLSTASRKIDNLEKAISTFAMDPTNRTSERRLRLLLHNLIGSGSSYGFDDVTDIARRMSDYLKQRHSDNGSADLTKMLRKEVDQLRKVFEKAEA